MTKVVPLSVLGVVAVLFLMLNMTTRTRQSDDLCKEGSSSTLRLDELGIAMHKYSRVERVRGVPFIYSLEWQSKEYCDDTLVAHHSLNVVPFITNMFVLLASGLLASIFFLRRGAQTTLYIKAVLYFALILLCIVLPTATLPVAGSEIATSHDSYSSYILFWLCAIAASLLLYKLYELSRKADASKIKVNGVKK